MRRLLAPALAALILLAFTSGIDARSRRKRAMAGTAGEFDYYLMSLSWSPEFCAGPNGARDDQQCGGQRRFGFVVHGLWPQYESGFPQACGPSSPVPQSLITAMLPLMPSPHLIQHEWDNHGTCSGLDVNAYFQQIQKAFASIRIPDRFKSPAQQIEIAPADITAAFVQSNPGFPPGGFRVQCSGQYLSEVRACLTKELKGRACSADVRDTCRSGSVIMRPLR